MKPLSLLLAASSLLPSTSIATTDVAISKEARAAAKHEALVRSAQILQDALESSPGGSLNSRAIDNAPSGYEPKPIPCPKDRPEIRRGPGLSKQELEWLPRRRNETIAPIRRLLKRLAIPDFDSDTYLANIDKEPSRLPVIGIAISGGGYRAMLTGAGALSSFDVREPGTEAKGNLGGLLQSSTVISGLSGGAWLVGSLYTNNFTTVTESVIYTGIWSFGQSVLQGPDNLSLLRYYGDMVRQVADKDKNYDTSIIDFWGRMISYQLVNDTNGGPGITYSSIADDDIFSKAKAPLPVLIANGRAPGEKLVSGNSTVYEFTPWEMGSRDPTLGGFAPLKYIGSKFNNGKLPEDTQCIGGFDNAGFVMGTSSSLFNQIVLYLKDKNNRYVPSDVPKAAISAITTILETLGESSNDIADWTPNPFKGFNPVANNGSTLDRLTLVDGGEDLQNVPYYPHIHPDRQVDVVFSIDSSADTESGWPDGASAAATYERSRTPISNGSTFPAAPGKDTMLNLGLNTRPTFFGCDADNTTSNSAGRPAPLIVYIPNYPYVYASNISTFQPTVSDSERDAIIANGWAIATQLNATRDPEWPACVACAMISRSLHRTKTPVPEACSRCFNRYCWNGTLAPTKAGAYYPGYFSKPISVKKNGAEALFVSSSVPLIAAVVALLLIL